MNKRLILCAVLSLAAAALSGCAHRGEPTTAVTWEELLAANRPAAVLEKAGAYTVFTEAEDTLDNTWYAAATQDGCIWTRDYGHASEDYRSGAIYIHSEGESSVLFVAPGSDALELFYDSYQVGLEDGVPDGGIRLHNGKYLAETVEVDEHFGSTLRCSAVFDAETLLLESVETRLKWGFVTSSSSTVFTYGGGAGFEQRSHAAITGAPDAVSVTLHGPGGAVEYRLSKSADIAVRSGPDDPHWCITADEGGEASVDDLAWVAGGHADLYFKEGEAPPAAPAPERVRQRSSFEYIYNSNYDSYNQSFMHYDGEDGWLGMTELAWIGGDAGMSYHLERRSAGDGVTLSALGRGGVWYEWSEEGGYLADFYLDESYPEGRMAQYRFEVPLEHLDGEMQRSEYGIWYIAAEEEHEDGSRERYRYSIADQRDYINYVVIDRLDAGGAPYSRDEISIYGNSGFNSERDVFEEMTAPERGKTVSLTVVAPGGSISARIRSDAAIAFEGGELYLDAACTRPVNGTDWAGGSTATVYAAQ